MGRLNDVLLVGIVNGTRIKADPETNEPLQALAVIEVVRGTRNAHDGKGHADYNYPLIITREPEQVRSMNTWKKGDLVQVKGLLATRNLKKTGKCPVCGTVNSVKDGTQAYIQPIEVYRIYDYSAIEDEKIRGDTARAKLLEMMEVSNCVSMIGNLCKDPECVSPDAKRPNFKVCQFELGITRNYHVRSAGFEQREDFPWIKAYGSVGKDALLRLHAGSGVTIDGFIQTRSLANSVPCSTEGCKGAIVWTDNIVEVVPYYIEYNSNYYTTEDVEARIHEAKLRSGMEQMAAQGADFVNRKK